MVDAGSRIEINQGRFSAMENRIAGRFVVDSGTIKEADTLRSLETLTLSSLGFTDSADSGRLIDVTITVKTVPGPKWARCEELGYYRTSKCNTLIAPGTKCSEEHFHRPNWATSPTLTDDDGAPVEVCITCQDRGIQPSRSRDADDSYNHSNRGR
jgi:hypothetical protein